jgi:hypothetical protein
MISTDRKHDKHAVREFERISIEELRKRTEVKKIFQFCDNCPGQYKSRGPFQFLSESRVPTVRTFFGNRHGKSEADGAIGRVKRAASLARQSRQEIILNARQFYDFCVKNNRKHNPDTNADPNKRFFQKFFFVENIPRTGNVLTETSTTDNTRKIQQIRSTGNPNIVEKRTVACMCHFCMHGKGQVCANEEYAGSWEAVDVRTGKLPKMAYTNQHWGNKRVSEIEKYFQVVFIAVVACLFRYFQIHSLVFADCCCCWKSTRTCGI